MTYDIQVLTREEMEAIAPIQLPRTHIPGMLQLIHTVHIGRDTRICGVMVELLKRDDINKRGVNRSNAGIVRVKKVAADNGQPLETVPWDEVDELWSLIRTMGEESIWNNIDVTFEDLHAIYDKRARNESIAKTPVVGGYV